MTKDTIQRTNQNSEKKHVAGEKRGKTARSKSRLVFSFNTVLKLDE